MAVTHKLLPPLHFLEIICIAVGAETTKLLRGTVVIRNQVIAQSRVIPLESGLVLKPKNIRIPWTF